MILSPVRLPVPPLQQVYDSFESTAGLDAQERREMQSGVDPKGVATVIVASLEGALMMSRLQRNDEALRRVQLHLNRYLDQEVARK